MGGSVASLIEGQAAARGQARYFTSAESGAALTFGELAASARRVAALLGREGYGPGTHVSLVMPNGLATVRLLLGAMAGGCCVNPVNLLSSPEQMRYVLDHSDSRVAFASPEWAPRLRELAAGIPRGLRVIELDPEAPALPGEREEDARAPLPPVAPGSLALLMYTSGTTGKPKGVMLSHANLVANARAISAEHALGPGDRVAAVLPLYHINAFAVTMLAPLAHGGSLVMPARFSAARFWPMAIESGCTWINVVPTIVSYLLEGEAPSREALSRIRFCRSASAALPPEHHLAFERKFGIGIIETMGLTETVAPAFSNPLEPSRRKVGSVGRASGCEARVVDERGAELADGTPGEIVIRGPQVTSGYYKNPEATAAAFFPDGWLRTGDIGRRDADGFFFITGRIKELIIKGGENIAPREIDEVLLRHPAVLDAAAVGVPDRHYGQEIAACVVRREGAACSEDDLRAFCLEQLGRYKTPKAIHFVQELPRGPSGKVQRLKLLDILPAAG
ncbi:MAG: AMP-binding protein [Betaproteobacteria bacterium]|nr:AMP-binding protein [Betaproteobacteria bacterium]PWB60860.1 MAG: long-chain fatty acid--CoA ligase [Betaproteobacteria bacterium]